MVMPMCSTGVNDMFEVSEWNITAVTESCKQRWGVTPRPDDVLLQYGGKNISAASNIIFRYGPNQRWEKLSYQVVIGGGGVGGVENYTQL